MARKKNKKRIKRAKALRETKIVDKQVVSEDEALSALTTKAEPWENWESQLVLYSIALALVGLIVLGALINWLIL